MSKFSRYLLVFGVLAGLSAAAGVWRYQTTRPDYRLRQGQAALLRGHFDEAEQLATRLEAAGHPDHAHLLRGQTYLHRGRLNLAILEYNEIRHDQESILAEASLIYGLGFLSLGHLSEAEKFLFYVVEIRPDDVDARRGLASIYYDRGAMFEALKHLEKWSELAEHEGQPHHFMGVIYGGMGADEPAVEHYRAALARDLKPEVREETVVALAEVLVKRADFTEALVLLDGCDFAVGGTPATVPELRAECLFGLGRYPEAVRVLEQALAERPPSPRALRLRAHGHVQAGEVSAAVALFEKALQLDPNDCPCRYQLALAYESLGRSAAATEQRKMLEECQSLIQKMSDLNEEAVRKPRDAGVRRRLAELCEKLNKYELARTWRKAAASCPQEGPPDAVTAADNARRK